MSPQERIRAAKSLFNRAKKQPGLTEAQRKEARRCAYNLMAINLFEAKVRLGLYVPPPRPASLRRSD
jgi:hypothetical protein